MYTYIERNREALLKNLDISNIERYVYLIANVKHCDDSEYQRVFKSFWTLSPARLSEDFLDHYFKLLKSRSDLSIREILIDLEKISCNKKETRKVHFSFSTKLKHTADPTKPIFDKMIKTFYFYKDPSRNSSPQQRIDDFMDFYYFLELEYERILSNDLLLKTINAFEKRIKNLQINKVKIIDTILWRFVDYMEKGALRKQSISYE